MKVGLLNNTKSRRNLGGLEQVHRIVRPFPHIACVDLVGVEGLGQALAGFAQERVEMIAINGGDGTVDAVLTEMIAGGKFQSPPLIAILPGGTTNMTAKDIGLPGRLHRSLKRLAHLSAGPRHAVTCKKSHLIEVRRQPGAPPLYGFFFGTAAIANGVLLSRRYLDRPKFHAGLGIAATIGAALFNILAGGKKTCQGDGQELFQGETIQVSPDGADHGRQLYLLNLVTTLDRLLFRSKPYWGAEAGALRYMAVRHPPARLLRALYPVFYGGKTRRFPSTDYHSCNAKTIAFQMRGSFVLDGEIYHAPSGAPVILREGPELNFVTWGP